MDGRKGRMYKYPNSYKIIQELNDELYTQEKRIRKAVLRGEDAGDIAWLCFCRNKIFRQMTYVLEGYCEPASFVKSGCRKRGEEESLEKIIEECFAEPGHDTDHELVQLILTRTRR